MHEIALLQDLVIVLGVKGSSESDCFPHEGFRPERREWEA